MKSTLILRSKFQRNGSRPGEIGHALSKAAAELEAAIKNGILQSIPGGRTYRKGAITRRESKRTAGLGLRRRGNSLIVGYNFHRASRAGQPPAILTGRLINSIRAYRVAEFKYRVGTSVVYAIYLDDPNGLNRPFFFSVAEQFRARFLEIMREAYFG